MTPEARKTGLVVDEVDGEVLVYDLGCDQAYCLKDVTALVWRAADGHTPVDVIIELVRQQSTSAIADEDVWAALESLSRAHLLVSAIQQEPAATVPSVNPGENR